MTIDEGFNSLVQALATIIQADRDKPVMFLSSDQFELKRWLKPDGVTTTTSTDPDRVAEFGLSQAFIDSLGGSPGGGTLPTPTFSTPSVTDTGFSVNVTNIPSGAAVVWTVNGVTDAATGVSLSKNSLSPSTLYSVTAKYVKSGWTDSAVATINITTNAAGATLPAPVFGTPSKTDTTFSVSVTNLPSGAAVVWTVGGVTDAATGATLSKTGLTASTAYNITAKFTKSGSPDSAVSNITVTTNAAATKLATPAFGTATKTDTTFSVPITNLNTGAAVVWTVNSVIDAQTGATLSKTGMTASTTYAVTAKQTQSGYLDSDVATINITTNASGGAATLLRTVKMSLQSDYGAPSGVAGWNDLQIPQAGIKAANGYTSAALKDTTGATTPFTLTNPKVWNNSVMNILGAGYPSTALYPAALGDTGIQSGSWSTPPGLKILSTDPTKYYKLYVGCLSDGASDVINIIVGSDTKSKNIYNNAGSNTESELASTMWTVFSNVQGSSITIDFSQNTNGSYFGLNCIILEEYDNATT